MIRHTVVFTLRHAAGSDEERDFLLAGMKLADIPGVRNFECLRQVSPKCVFHFGFSMEFDSHVEFQNYNAHPFHTWFVENRWRTEVRDFQEIDYVRAQLTGAET
jgi:hypothetical protein